MMQVIEKDFESFINQFEWHDASFPIVQNVNAQGETDATTIKSNMIKQLYSPVEFIDSKRMVNCSRCRSFYRNWSW